MNKFSFIAFLVLQIFFTSCTSSNEMEDIPDNQVQLIEVRLKLGGEFIAYRNLPNRMQETNFDLFGIQIIDIENDKPYAYVVGDDISDIKIDFPKNQEYQVKMTYLKDAKNIVRYIPENIWGDPFVADYTETELNKVYYSSATHLRGVSSPFIDTEEMNSPLSFGEYVPLDRYYGRIDSFQASQDSLTLNLQLKRMVFGIDLSLEFLDPEIKEVVFTINSNNHQQEYSIFMENGKGKLHIPYLSIGLSNIYPKELDNALETGYEDNVHISIGTPENSIRFYDDAIKVPRNTMMHLSFVQKTTAETSKNPFELNLQEGEMEEVQIDLPPTN